MFLDCFEAVHSICLSCSVVALLLYRFVVLFFFFFSEVSAQRGAFGFYVGG